MFIICYGMQTTLYLRILFVPDLSKNLGDLKILEAAINALILIHFIMQLVSIALINTKWRFVQISLQIILYGSSCVVRLSNEES